MTVIERWECSACGAEVTGEAGHLHMDGPFEQPWHWPRATLRRYVPADQLQGAVKRYDELLTWLHVAHRHPGDVQACAACVIAVQLAHDTTATRERGA